MTHSNYPRLSPVLSSVIHLCLLTSAILLMGSNALAQVAASPNVARLITSVPANPSKPAGASAANLEENSAASQMNSIERRAFDQTNVERQKNGLPPFTWDADLFRIARLHSENMSRTGLVSHVTPEGLRLRDRARAAGIEHFSALGENIAYNLGYDDP